VTANELGVTVNDVEVSWSVVGACSDGGGLIARLEGLSAGGGGLPARRRGVIARTEGVTARPGGVTGNAGGLRGSGVGAPSRRVARVENAGALPPT
jgi:hypothetical protein